MIVEIDKSFAKSLSKINDHALFSKIENIIQSMEVAKTPLEIQHTKKLSGFKNYYRTRIGEFRLGFEKINSQTIRLIIIAHRKEIYTSFP